MPSLADYFEKAKDVLSERPIPEGTSLSYFTYVRDLYRLQRTHLGQRLTEAAREKHDRWVRRGLDPETLTALADKACGVRMEANERGDASQ